MSKLSTRPAAIDDAEVMADIATAFDPDDPTDPLMLRHWWYPHDPTSTTDRYALLQDGSVVGQCLQYHGDWAAMPTRYARVEVTLHPHMRSDDNLNWAFDWIEDHARKGGAKVFTARCLELDRQLIELLQARGYGPDRRHRHWELDLVTNREALLNGVDHARSRMAEQGVRLLTLADDIDPDRFQKLYELDREGEQDVPTTVPFVPQSFDAFMKWFDSPSLHLDRLWIAREGEAIVGLSALAYPPVRGHVSTDWTTTRRSVRGRGIARALKLETVAQAIGLGVERVRTSNDSENAPILHINAQLGYTAIPGTVSLLKPA
jgi:GNAT superfamily N-acetyltransferase